MPRNKDNLALNYFNDHLQEIAGTYYDGDERKAFRHASFQALAPDPALSDEQVIEMTAIDKSGDMEIDGWFVDDESETVFLFQAVGGKSKVDEAKITKFWEAPNELLNAERMAKSKSQATKELSRELDARLGEDYSVSMVFASRGGFAPASRAFAESKGAMERPAISLSGEKLSYPCYFRLDDQNHVAEAFFNFRISLAAELPKVVLSIDRDWSYVVNQSGLKSMRATVSASEIVKVFNENKFKLFLLNPRGPLANAKVNKSIRKTLDEPEGRAVFHLLNNGMCATCKDFEIDTENTRVSIVNFQIVNGCQTTVTLSKRSDEELNDTYVDLKLVVADEAMAQNIAEASNSQTALRPKDYTSFDQKQLYLKDDFERLKPPWYYEIKQGYWSHVLEDKEKAKFKTGRTKRHIEVQSMAQASLAFLGEPTIALDRVRYVFQGIRSSEDRETYEKAFPGNVRAHELVLPWKILAYITKQPPKLRHSKYHIVWLISMMLRKHYNLPNSKFFSRDLSDMLVSKIDSWLPDRYDVADDACELAFQRAQHITSDPNLEMREFFRGKGSFGGTNSSQMLEDACMRELTRASRRPDFVEQLPSHSPP